MPEVGRLTCYRCKASYPNVFIVKCQNMFLGEVYLCKCCHKRFHPACKLFVNAVLPEDKLCDVCMSRDATVVCPQCRGRYMDVQLCDTCNMETHCDLRQAHTDHIRAIPE